MITSFVALLAGEGHTHAPATASPFIRHFAIVLNDAMPEVERQRLKLFAPRIVDTNDGLDLDRLNLVQHAFKEELLPQLHMDQACRWLPGRLEREWSLPAKGGTRPLQDLIAAVADGAYPSVAGCGSDGVAEAAARLLAICAEAAPGRPGSNWYWSKAVDVLDRLCSLGVPGQPVGENAAHVAPAAYILDHRKRFEVAALVLSEVSQRFRGRLGLPASHPGLAANVVAQ